MPISWKPMEANQGGYAEIENMDEFVEVGSPKTTHGRPPEEDRLLLNSTLFLDYVGEVNVTMDSSGLSWKRIDDSPDNSTCLGIQFSHRGQSEIKFSEIYAVELANCGLIRECSLLDAGRCLLNCDSEMHRFVVHGFRRSKTQPSLWVLASYIFGHKDLKACKTWVEKIDNVLTQDVGRPKNLLVFVHPFSGKGKGCMIWESVSPIFTRAKVATKVIITQRAGHALDTMLSLTDEELKAYDGAVAVGGDGFFNEIMNGFLCTRHAAPYPPTPAEFSQSTHKDKGVMRQDDVSGPLLYSTQSIESASLNTGTGARALTTGQGHHFSLPHPWIRFGIIPAGSTDAIVISSTGVRDPVTSALHIVLGKQRFLDVARIVRWKVSSSSMGAPSVHYAASFAGYGFYGDVIKESETCRWMGPVRYDYAGTKVFLQHRSYEAEVFFVASNGKEEDNSETGTQMFRERIPNGPEKKFICRVECPICSEGIKPVQFLPNDDTSRSYSDYKCLRWTRTKGRFLSVGAAIISCRNERAPEGIVADAHLADGFLHLILIRDCPHALYLWFARRGEQPARKYRGLSRGRYASLA
ncbi:ceramide kinase isoform X2 [Nymphaea colorata]|uniref:ceramide kinase isoform X2 n=1 Tax=Nymphaea colorata TaxID=210225 RepID=UPI00129DDABB|nr:ceramide kinase isoform X2 [Nymphaea colorata]